MSNNEHHDEFNGPKGAYANGYGKPPAAHRFQPGQSGNPRGRPRKVASFGEAITKMLASSTTTVINGRRRRKTMIEVAVIRVQKDMATGSMRALERWIPLIERFAPTPDRTAPSPTLDLDQLTEEQLRVIASIKLR